MSDTSNRLNFIEEIIETDLASGSTKQVLTRFPPEPNGYLHIGHAKSICLNFGVAERYGGYTNLRFDDTNPTAEKDEYVQAIREDVRWLGFDWGEREFYASDYFDRFYEFAKELIQKGLAYVDESTPELIAEQKGTVVSPGTNSPHRERSVEENLRLFEEMKDGKKEEGACVLRAKIDMAHPNMNMRDPVIYRIKHQSHHRTGDRWHIYPMYDFAHGLSDSIEQVTHSICTLEFENHRPLYDWFLEVLDVYPSRQYEFARLNLSYTIMSKRKLKRLVEEGYVQGWDDPRMPTIQGLRRRGYSARSIRMFAEKIGVAKRDNVIDLSLLEFCGREDLNTHALRRMVVLDPIKVTITNYPEGAVEMLSSENNPEDPAAGAREVPFSRELYIERSDFMEDPPKKYFRMAVGRYVRLKSAYILLCESVVKDHNGDIEEIRCTYIENSKSGEDVSGIKAKGTLHWVSVAHAIPAQVNLYDRLFRVESPDGDKEVDFVEHINPESLHVLERVYCEPELKHAKAGEHYQFLRHGYFCLDKISGNDHLVFNRTVTLRDGWKNG